MTERRLDLECTLPAPPDRVFGMFTEPGELSKWWGPRGFTIPTVELRAAVGARYRISMRPPEGEVFHLVGEFIEVTPHRLAFTFRWEEPAPDDRETVVTIDLVPAGDATTVRLSQGAFATDERLALHHDGWTQSLEKLRALFE